MIAVAGIVLIGPTGSASAACPNESLRAENGSLALPDCRAYEQVSPAEKGGYQALNKGWPVQATPDGEGLAFVSYGAYADPLSSSLPDAYVARRGLDGWQTTNVSPPNPDPTPPGGDPVSYDFSPDLTRRVVQVPLQSLAEGADPEVSNLFLGTEVASYSWINSTPPPVPLPSGCPFPEVQSQCWQVVDRLAFAGASADFQRVLLEAEGSLVTGAPEAPENLYESAFEGGAWHVSFVGILPDGQAAAGGSTAGSGSTLFYSTANPGNSNRVAQAMSDDGGRVIFQAASDEGETYEAGQLALTEIYDRIEGAETIEISRPAPGANPANPTAQPATFWAASDDGSHIFFTSSAELTSESNTGPANEGSDLYEYDLEDEELSDLSVDSTDPTGAGVLGVLGASRDGSYVYFAADGQLVPGEGEVGKPNIYVVHDGGAPVYVATVGETDGGDWTQQAAALESYVTGNGLTLAFTSRSSVPTANFPIGYDNVNDATGEAEREVYLYSAGSRQVICASCDPTGESPVGPGVLGGVNRQEFQSNFQSTPFHQVRSVSEDGNRVFFTSQDPLVSSLGGDEAQARVYEYERVGEGSCQAATGCVYLLSSPTATDEAVFLDSDESGDNAFIATPERLTASDRDQQLDIFDARHNGGFSQPPPLAPCEGDGCHGPSTQAPSAVGAATQSFMGQGNIRKKHAKPCPKGSVRRHRRCVRRHPHPRRHHHGTHPPNPARVGLGASR